MRRRSSNEKPPIRTAGAILGRYEWMSPTAIAWFVLGALSSRVVLLAHHPSNALAGRGIGVLLNKAAGPAHSPARR